MIQIEPATPDTVRYIIERPREIEQDAYRVMGIADPLVLVDSLLKAEHAFVTLDEGKPTTFFSLTLDPTAPVAKYIALCTPAVLAFKLLHTKLARDFHRWGAEQYPDRVHVSCAYVDSPAIRFMRVVGLEPTHIVELNGLPIQVLRFDADKYSHQQRIINWDSKQQQWPESDC